MQNQHLTGASPLRSALLIFCVSLYFFISVATPIGAATKSPSSIATIEDTDGGRAEVKELMAVYGLGYTSPGYLKESAQAELSVLLLFKEAHVTTSRHLEIPLTAIAALLLRHKPTFRLTVEKKNGSLVVITSDSFTETLPDGKSTTTKIEKAKFVSTLGGIIEIKRSDYKLVGFQGRAATSKGEEGEFYLEFEKVASITFH